MILLKYTSATDIIRVAKVEYTGAGRDIVSVEFPATLLQQDALLFSYYRDLRRGGREEQRMDGADLWWVVISDNKRHLFNTLCGIVNELQASTATLIAKGSVLA